MKTLLFMVLVAQQRPLPPGGPPPAYVDAAREARLSEELLLEEEEFRVLEVRVPKGLKELHFAPDRMGFFVIGGERVIWQNGPVVIRGPALHVEFLKKREVKAVAAAEGVVFENSVIRVNRVTKGDGKTVEWNAGKRELLLRQMGQGLRVELKF